MLTPLIDPLMELTLTLAVAPLPYGSSVNPLITPVVDSGENTGDEISPARVKTPAVTVTAVLVTEGLVVAKYVVPPLVVSVSEFTNTLNVGLINTTESTACAEN
jgi:hypothetical protein